VSGHRYLWIFDVVGGEPCKLQPEGNPVMKHDGERSLLRCLCTDEAAEQLKEQLEKLGAKVRTNSPRETAEQTVERKNLFAVLGGDEEPYPTPKCPACAWFDHQTEGRCGAGMLAWKGHLGWSADAIAERMKLERFARDYEACPLSRLEGPPHEGD
jgi:hypothetical protein